MNIYNEIVENIKQNKIFVLATLVNSGGSTPRKTTAKMIVYPDGKIFGTIGGGAIEKIVIAECQNLISSNTQSMFKKYSLSQTGENATGMCCGGTVEVYMELHATHKRLLIFGGGHIGTELTRLASNSGFKITVVDDRKDVLESFDSEIETVMTDPDYESNFPEINQNSFIVIVTHTHQLDCAVLKQVIEKDCEYIGMVGSRAKIAKMFNFLIENGVDQKSLDKVHAPIGLDIKAEGPHEIAVAILAELIAVKNKIKK